MLALLLVVLAAGPTIEEIDQARAACERDYRACPRLRELEAADRQADDERREAREAEERALLEAQRIRVAERDAEEQAKEEAIKKRCGKDYGRVRVGMAFKRVAECAGPFDLVGEDRKGQVYESTSGIVRVEGGKVVRWVAQ